MRNSDWSRANWVPESTFYKFWKIAQIFLKIASFWWFIVEKWSFFSTNSFGILKGEGLRRKCTKNYFIKQTWHHFFLQGFEKYPKKWYKDFCTFFVLLWPSGRFCVGDINELFQLHLKDNFISFSKWAYFLFWQNAIKSYEHLRDPYKKAKNDAPAQPKLKK